MSIEEFYDDEGEDREGLEYLVGIDGTVNVDQVTMDQVAAAVERDEL
jgi:hypothetical protein